MPRKVRTRATRPTPGLDPAVLGYLVDGNFRRAADDLKARGQGRLILFRHPALAVLWRANREAIFAEAKRRRLKGGPWRVHLDRWNGESFDPDHEADAAPKFPTYPNDPRLNLLEE